MYELYDLRRRYGISLSEMAAYLDVSKSLVAKAERMERTLPLLAGVKLLAIRGAAIMHDEARMNIVPSLRQQQHANQYAGLLVQMEHRIMRCMVKVDRLTKKLAKVAASYPATADFMELAGHLPQFIEGNAMQNKKEQVWLADMREAASLKLKKCNLDAQSAIRVEINMLQAEQAVLQENISYITKLLLDIIPSGEMVPDVALTDPPARIPNATAIPSRRKKR